MFQSEFYVFSYPSVENKTLRPLAAGLIRTHLTQTFTEKGDPLLRFNPVRYWGAPVAHTFKSYNEPTSLNSLYSSSGMIFSME